MYTEKLHAKRLLKMLEKKDPCMCCPKIQFYYYNRNYKVSSIKKIEAEKIGMDELACRVCTDFVNAHKCPCWEFGDFEAIKRTWIALEDKGYLE